jgi:hypothetical protein
MRECANAGMKKRNAGMRECGECANANAQRSTSDGGRSDRPLDGDLPSLPGDTARSAFAMPSSYAMPTADKTADRSESVALPSQSIHAFTAFPNSHIRAFAHFFPLLSCGKRRNRVK